MEGGSELATKSEPQLPNGSCSLSASDPNTWQGSGPNRGRETITRRGRGSPIRNGSVSGRSPSLNCVPVGKNRPTRR